MDCTSKTAPFHHCFLLHFRLAVSLYSKVVIKHRRLLVGQWQMEQPKSSCFFFSGLLSFCLQLSSNIVWVLLKFCTAEKWWYMCVVAETRLSVNCTSVWVIVFQLMNLKTQKCLVCFPAARKVKGLSTEAQVTALSTYESPVCGEKAKQNF